MTNISSDINIFYINKGLKHICRPVRAYVRISSSFWERAILLKLDPKAISERRSKDLILIRLGNERKCLGVTCLRVRSIHNQGDPKGMDLLCN